MSDKESVQQRHNDTLEIPIPTFALAGLENETHLEVCALTGAVVVLKARMTAKDLVDVIDSIMNLFVDCCLHLGAGTEGCRDCGACRAEELDETSVPIHVLEKAGLPAECKLEAFVEEGIITVHQKNYQYDLNDIPPELLRFFLDMGMCAVELEDRLMREEILYGRMQPE